MKAILLKDGGFEIQETDSPKIQVDHVRVRIEAVGVNRADLIQRKGLYPAPKGTRNDILGLEYAGTIIECGGGVQTWKLGARVMGIAAGATYAQEIVVHQREVLAIPSGMTIREAAAIPEAFLTAYDALEQLDLRLGQRLLIHGIGSGVGNAALQLAKIMGASVVGTSRSLFKLEASAALEQAICVQEGNFYSSLHGKVDCILDFIGGDYLEQNLRSLKPGGSMIVLGVLGGAKANLNLGLLLVKKIKIFGSTLRSRPLEEKISLAQRFSERVLPLFEQDRLRPLVDRVFHWTEAEEAHLYMEQNQNLGKIILTIEH